MISFKRKVLKTTLAILSITVTCNLYAGENKRENAYPSNQRFDQQQTQSIHDFNFDEIKKLLWNKYQKDAQNLMALKAEYDNRALKYKNKTMRFSLEKRGKAPSTGYPLYIALHGGGQTSPQMNDSQWQAMKIYYRDSVNNGIYVATRGITNNWKLHFEDESYPLYDKLIESAILFDNVDPNRVYLLGFSAGGDGVYQVVPRMPERFAAANMSAGHHNWIPFDNLYNTPFLLQVGELDGAYERNHVAAENNITLNKLQAKYKDGFHHELFIHYNGSHNSWLDNDFRRANQPIIADPTAWHEKSIRNKIARNTNAIDWISQYERNPTPQKLIWDLSTGADERVYQTGAALSGEEGYNVGTLAQPKALFYWLDVSVAEIYPATGRLVIEAFQPTNTIKVSEVVNVDKFRILLNPHLLNLAAPIKIEVGGKLIGTVNVKENIATMTRTLLERSDKNEIYDAQIMLIFNKKTQKWEITT
jgi:predicted esterase